MLNQYGARHLLLSPFIISRLIAKKNYAYAGYRYATFGGKSRARAAHSCQYDNFGSDGFCCRLRRLGLYLFGDPHWDRIVSTADPGRVPPHGRGPVPLPDPSQEDRVQAVRRTLACSRHHWRSVAIRRKWRP